MCVAPARTKNLSAYPLHYAIGADLARPEPLPGMHAAVHTIRDRCGNKNNFTMLSRSFSMAVTSETMSSLTGDAVRAPSVMLNGNPVCLPDLADRELLFRQLVSQHHARLYRFITKYIDHPDDAADIAQQAFAEASRTIATFRGESKLSTWLFGIAMNMVRNYLSRAPHRIYKFENEDSLTSLAAPGIEPSEHLNQREMLELVFDALAELPDEMSEVLSMVAVDEISYQEVANRLGIPLGTVRSRVSRARAGLRSQLEKAGVGLAF
jgi:RNA polymerase sigma-70 factor (ECF subfamily)